MAKRWLTEAQVDAHAKFYSRTRWCDKCGAPPGRCVHQTLPAPVLPPAGLHITLPMPPSVNELYGTAPNGQKFLTEAQRDYRADVIGIVHIALRGKVEPFAGRLQVSMRLHFANRRRTDIDGRLKAALDALTHAKAYKDDSQIDKLTVERVIDPDGNEYCTVEIREMA